MGRVIPDSFGISDEGKRAFTLVEVMVSGGLASLLLVGLFAAFFHLSKTGVAMGNYHDLEQESRNALQYFARDVHQASKAVWENPETVRLSVDGEVIGYIYQSRSGRFVRKRSGQEESVLASGIQELQFRAYDISGNELSLQAGAGSLTKMIQVSMVLERRAGRSANRASVVSSRYMMRNKEVL